MYDIAGAQILVKVQICLHVGRVEINIFQVWNLARRRWIGFFSYTQCFGLDTGFGYGSYSYIVD